MKPRWMGRLLKCKGLLIFGSGIAVVFVFNFFLDYTSTNDFCDRCHNYLAVSPYCWDCHVDPKEFE